MENDELPAAQLAQDPATLVTIQAGADDIAFDQCLTWDLAKLGPKHFEGQQCVKHGQVTKALHDELQEVQDALVREITEAAPYAQHIAVLNYYQAIPRASDIRRSSIYYPHGQVDPVCWLLSNNAQGTRSDATIIQSALNGAILKAVDQVITSADLPAGHTVQPIDVSGIEAGHEMCTKSRPRRASRTSRVLSKIS